MEKLLSRFLRYVQIDTQSNPDSETCPSSHKQWNLAKVLNQDLIDLGLVNVTLDEKCYIMAELPSNSTKSFPVIGFIAHMDTSPDMTGENVKPQIIEQYQGGDILLNREKGIKMLIADFPELNNYIGNTLITTDGTTLLGADNKSGIAIILSAIEHLIQHPEIEHGTIKLAFTPDEEIGRGADYFNVEKFGAHFAYTIDGGELGELEYETFNAAQANITITGRNVHPGTAKNKMLNANMIVHELTNMLPVEQRPEFTQDYEGFFHLTKVNSTVEKAEMQFIIRDHDNQKFLLKKQILTDAIKYLNTKYNRTLVSIEMEDQYFNMRQQIEPVIEIVHLVSDTMDQLGITPKIIPVRGGTDGARLSFMGLPTPNIFTGGHNFHGVYEFISLQSMQKAVNLLVKLVQNAANIVIK